MTMCIEPPKKKTATEIEQNLARGEKRSQHKKVGGREVLPVKLSEQMGIWLQLQSFPTPNGQYPVIH